MGKKQPSILLLTFVLLIIACSSKNLVVLIPDPDGAVGRITISNQAGSVEIFKPNQAAKIKDRDTAPNLPVNMKKMRLIPFFLKPLQSSHYHLSVFCFTLKGIPLSLNLVPLGLLAKLLRTSD